MKKAIVLLLIALLLLAPFSYAEHPLQSNKHYHILMEKYSQFISHLSQQEAVLSVFLDSFIGTYLYYSLDTNEFARTLEPLSNAIALCETPEDYILAVCRDYDGITHYAGLPPKDEILNIVKKIQSEFGLPLQDTISIYANPKIGIVAYSAVDACFISELSMTEDYKVTSFKSNYELAKEVSTDELHDVIDLWILRIRRFLDTNSLSGFVLDEVECKAYINSEGETLLGVRMLCGSFKTNDVNDGFYPTKSDLPEMNLWAQFLISVSDNQILNFFSSCADSMFF